MSRASSGEDVGVYLVTDASQAARHGRGVVDTVVAAVAGGVRWVQLRCKAESDDEVLRLLRAVGEALPVDVRLVVNDRLGVVRTALDEGVRVDGLHLGQADGSAEQARTVLGARPLLGVSASTPEQLRAAARAGADLVGIGAVHTTTTKTDAPAPLGTAGACALASVARGLGLAPVAIGGLGADDLAELRAGGFAGAAVVSAICAVPEPTRAARRLVRAWDGAR
ncbi:thiamine phosphate synthase [Nocardioides sp. CFH 31398]|uniref:thiamine phosphate synthase n=1 Tax=Nocardioides sp. CFH 31398 TaxID=2919579 RepID=UPI001F05D6CC|nr:thiamine phosphate synthase [Nocardioides sp. CFH 31398]MCH1868860.1 thiamine phosphate synthase [Nocardioides sp. CFH 31398]